MCILKKLQRPTNDQTILTDVGDVARLMQASLSLPGVMPCGVNVNPR